MIVAYGRPGDRQLAIFCAYRVARAGARFVGGLGVIVPAVGLVLALSVLFLSHARSLWVRGAGPA